MDDHKLTKPFNQKSKDECPRLSLCYLAQDFFSFTLLVLAQKDLLGKTNGCSFEGVLEEFWKNFVFLKGWTKSCEVCDRSDTRDRVQS